MPEALRVWNDGEWLEYDLKQETEAVRAERLWSEAALQAQRRNNARWHSSSTQSRVRIACPPSVSNLQDRELIIGRITKVRAWDCASAH